MSEYKRKTTFDFGTQKAAGKLGEAKFLELWPELKPTSGLAGDFTTPSGAVVELKSDSYTIERTTNFFMERYGDIKRQAPGGPWQAMQHGCKYFVYYYPKSGVAYVFEVQQLVAQLNALVPQLKMFTIYNSSWQTGGFKVPRVFLQDICLAELKVGQEEANRLQLQKLEGP